MFGKEVNVKVSEVPEGWSIEAADFINKLLRRKAKNRLGKSGVTELKDHSWLRGIQWTDIYKKEVITPYSPHQGDNFDANYCNRQDPVDRQTYDYYLHKIHAENYFQNFYFNFYDPKSKDPHFEYDGTYYKFTNLHEETISVSTERGKEQKLKSSLTALSTTTPRLDNTNFSQTIGFNQSHLSQRKLFG